MTTRELLAWIAAGLAGCVLLAWLFPRAFPLFPRAWEVTRQEARAIAEERLRDLGELPADAFVRIHVDPDPALEYRLQSLVGRLPAAELRGSRLARSLFAWEVVVYAPGAADGEWSYRARVALDGEPTALERREPPEAAGGAIDPGAARPRADAFLREQGFDPAEFEEPQVRTRQLEARTDTVLRYRDRERLLGESIPYGLEVTLAGDRLAGFAAFYDDPDPAAARQAMQALVLVNQAWVFLPLLLVPLVAVPFVRRYHAGEIGVRRGLEAGAVVLAGGLVTLVFCAPAAAAEWSLGLLTPRQILLVVSFQLMVLFFVPLALLAFLGWSVGESLCRARWGDRLAGFDAVFRGEWRNATVARESLRGLVSGVLVLAGGWLLVLPLRLVGAWPSTAFLLGPWWHGAQWFSVPLLAFGVAYSLYAALFGRLLLVPLAMRAAGRSAGLLLAVLAGGLIFFPLFLVIPAGWGAVVWVLQSAAFVFLFLRYGLLTSALACASAWVGQGAVALLGSLDPSVQFQAALALLGVAAPLIVSLRHLQSGREVAYRYDDVAPHVRRIAERERQKVELETARRIQSSILPRLPPRLNGIDLAHSYLPAREVGGDFYEVLALEDGRLAVALGDVAGHGVSSGLVMSMTKSALSVQVSFDPEVEAVFATLNRMVYQSARRRLLATLCYALIDPAERRIRYASAGHLFPYRIQSGGEISALESVCYPLGARDRIEVQVRTERLTAGDLLFLFSDGVVEARPADSDELFGFERLERSLARHAHGGVEGLRDGVLADISSFSGNADRQDDLTLLVLRLP